MFLRIVIFTFFFTLFYGALANDCSVPWIENGDIKEQALATRQLNWFTRRFQRPLQYKNLPVGSTPPENATLFLVCQHDHVVLGLGVSSIKVTCSDGKWSKDLVCFKNPPRMQSRLERGPSNHSTDRVPSSEDSLCFCEVTEMDESVVAYMNRTEILLHDRVQKGSAVKFRCEKVGFDRLIGQHEILCKDCQAWDSDEFPTCLKPSLGDAVIFYDSNVNISMDGFLEVQEGQSLRLTCIALGVEEFPLWSVPDKRGISEHQEVMENEKGTFYISYLDIESISSSSEGSYVCVVGKHLPAMVKLRIKNNFCNPPKDPKNGNVTYTSLKSGSQLTFECNNGYHLEDTEPVYCTPNGQWSKINVGCVEDWCEMPPPPEHGRVQLAGVLKLGSLAIFLCDDGRTLFGASAAKCLFTRQWTAQPPKCLSSCVLPAVSNGSVGYKENRRTSRYRTEDHFVEFQVGKVFQHNETAIFRCKDGFILAGRSPQPNIGSRRSENVTCEDGQWSQSLECKPERVCEKPLSPEHGTVHLVGKPKVGSIANYSCDDGWELVGAAASECLVTGQWKLPPPACKLKDCSVPYIQHGNIEELVQISQKFDWRKMRWERKTTFNKIQVGTLPSENATLRLVCDPDHLVPGSEFSRFRVTCSDGKWSKDLVCVRKIACKMPLSPKHGTVHLVGEPKVGSIANYSCDDGWELVGAAASECLVTGQWTFPPPACRKDCSVPYIQHGNIQEQFQKFLYNWWKYRWENQITHNKIQVGTLPSENATLYLVCDPDYLVPGSRLSRIRVTCSDGKWSKDLVCVRKSVCEKPSSPEHGTMHLVGEPKVGSIANYSCDDGWKLVGAAASECLVTGQWKFPPPSCKLTMTCPQFMVTEGMSVRYSNGKKVGSIATFGCTDPLLLLGQSTLQCLQTGQWNHLQPTCETSGCLIEDFTGPENVLPNMEDVTEELLPIGSKLSMICEEGFVLIGDKEAECGPLGKWDYGKPQCVLGCHLNIKDVNPELIFSPVKEYYRFGEFVTLSCPENFELTSNVERVMCMNDGWSDPIPDCQKKKTEK